MPTLATVSDYLRYGAQRRCVTWCNSGSTIIGPNLRALGTILLYPKSPCGRPFLSHLLVELTWIKKQQKSTTGRFPAIENPNTNAQPFSLGVEAVKLTASQNNVAEEAMAVGIQHLQLKQKKFTGAQRRKLASEVARAGERERNQN